MSKFDEVRSRARVRLTKRLREQAMIDERALEYGLVELLLQLLAIGAITVELETPVGKLAGTKVLKYTNKDIPELTIMWDLNEFRLAAEEIDIVIEAVQSAIPLTKQEIEKLLNW